MNFLLTLPLRLLKIIAAFFVFLLGVILLPLPGPGLEVIGFARALAIKAVPALVPLGEKLVRFWYWVAPLGEETKPHPLRKLK